MRGLMLKTFYIFIQLIFDLEYLGNVFCSKYLFIKCIYTHFYSVMCTFFIMSFSFERTSFNAHSTNIQSLLFIHSFIRIHSFFIHSFDHSFFIHSFIYLFIHHSFCSRTLFILSSFIYSFAILFYFYIFPIRNLGTAQ